MSDTPPDAPLPLETYELRDGIVESEHSQESVDAFAADFQALRHFGEKLGSAFDLPAPWMGALQEPDYTVVFSSPQGDSENQPTGSGGRIGQRALLFELLSTITDNEQD